MGDGLQYPTLNQHHTSPTSYHSMDDTRNRLEVQPTDKLINKEPTTTAEAMSPSPNNDEQQLRNIVIDMNHEYIASSSGGGGDGDTTSAACLANGNIAINMDNLNTDSNNPSLPFNNVVEIHART